MKNIEITTSQNVTIQYDLASVFERIIALSLDIMFMGLLYLILWALQALIAPGEFMIMFYFTVIPILLLYSLVFEYFNNGQSFGKLILKLRVIRIDGEKAGFTDYLMRWIFRILDIYGSLGGVAILSIVSSRSSQRIGDLLANTVVVNISKSERMKLESLLKLNHMNSYKATYPQVAKVSEEAMLLVKETLTKNIQINNEAHHLARSLLVKKIERELNIQAPHDQEAFLKTLLSDYVMLTR